MYLITAGSTTAVVQDANGTDHIAAIQSLSGLTLTGASGGLVAAYARTVAVTQTITVPRC